MVLYWVLLLLYRLGGQVRRHMAQELLAAENRRRIEVC